GGRGPYFRLGVSRATSSSRDDLTNIDSGDLVVTNQRLFFAGKQSTANAVLKKILSIEVYPNSIILHKDGKERAQHFRWPNNLVKIHAGAASEPLTGSALQTLVSNQLSNAPARSRIAN